MSSPDPHQQLATTAVAFLDRITGGVISEINQLLALPFKEFRLRNTIKASLRTKALLEEYGLKPEQLTGELRTIIPIIEAVASEDDPTLQEMWSSLLATSLMPEFNGTAEPDYHKLLAQLSPPEARLLNGLHREEIKQSDAGPKEENLHHLATWLGIPDQKCEVLLQHLWSLNLLRGPGLTHASVLAFKAPTQYEMTALGVDLMGRCTFFTPKP